MSSLVPPTRAAWSLPVHDGPAQTVRTVPPLSQVRCLALALASCGAQIWVFGAVGRCRRFPGSAAVMPCVSGWAARRGTGRRRGGLRHRRGGIRSRRRRSRGRRSRRRRSRGCWRRRGRARPRRSRWHRDRRSRRSCRIARRRAGRRALAARRAVAGHQQRDRDGGHDEEESRDASGQGCPEASLLQAGVDGLPQPGQASRACMNSPVIPASHETGRYRVTCRQGGSTAKNDLVRHAAARYAGAPGRPFPR